MTNDDDIKRNTDELIKEYDEQRKKTLKRILFISLICAGATLIVCAFLFRTQYPMSLKNEGQRIYNYDHILLREVQHYDAFNKYKGHTIKYYIVYRSGDLFYEYETNFTTYSDYANRENAVAGIMDHSAIKETLVKYTFYSKSKKTYCYDKKTNILKALYDAGNENSSFPQRALCYAAGAALIIIFSLKLKKSYIK
jgi:hypothetical protein